NPIAASLRDTRSAGSVRRDRHRRLQPVPTPHRGRWPGAGPVGSGSTQRAVDIGLAGVLDRIEARAALVTAQRVKLLNRSRLADVVSKHRDIDVFGEAVD